MTTFVSSGVLATRTPLPLLLTSSHLVPPSVCFSATPQTTRVTAALTSPLAGSSSLAMWCLMSPFFLTPPHPHHLPPTLTLTSSLLFRLTWCSSLLFFLFLQVLSHRLLLPARCLSRVRWRHLRWCHISVGLCLRSPPGRAGLSGLPCLRGRWHRPLRLALNSRCASTSAGCRRQGSHHQRRRRPHRCRPYR
jgi:hypothetical protein